MRVTYLLVGVCLLYTSEIRVFIPRELRKLAECPSSEVCPQFISEPCSIKEAYFKDR